MLFGTVQCLFIPREKRGKKETTKQKYSSKEFKDIFIKLVIMTTLMNFFNLN